MKWTIPIATLFLAGCGPREEEALTWSVWATLNEASDFPTLKEIRPYRDALIAHEYEITGRVVENEGVEMPPAKIAVYHWAIVDGERTEVSKLKQGDFLYLEIQPMSDRPELKGRFRKNGLDAFDLQEFFALEWRPGESVKH